MDARDLMFRAWIACATLVFLVGCAGNREFGTAPGIEVTDLTELPMPTDAEALAFQPFESVEISVLQDSSLSGTYFIDANGDIIFPLVGSVRAAGLSSSELTELLRSRLGGNFILDPDVTVRPTEIGERSVSFGGEISNSGSYPIANARTLLRGVNQAGGVTEFARTDDVLIMRMVDGQKYIGAYNLRAIQRGNYPDPELAPGDIVMVGDSPAQRRLRSILPYLSLLTTGFVLYDRVAN